MSSSLRDLDYESKNIGFYVQDQEDGIKCKNYELCEAVLPNWWFDCKGKYFCIDCLSFGWGKLNFKYEEQECNVCNELVNVLVEFPTNCNHYFCCQCSRNILFWDETRYWLNPTLFGCPPCPNGCVNPDLGKQCACEEYTEVIDAWERDKPDEFNEYNDAENLSIYNSDKDPFYGNQKCPLCRKVYNNK